MWAGRVFASIARAHLLHHCAIVTPNGIQYHKQHTVRTLTILFRLLCFFCHQAMVCNMCCRLALSCRCNGVTQPSKPRAHSHINWTPSLAASDSSSFLPVPRYHLTRTIKPQCQSLFSRRRSSLSQHSGCSQGSIPNYMASTFVQRN